jgi:carbonic anhydrase
MKKSIILFILYFVLNVNASTCDSGHRQSPVDIRSIDLNYVWIPKLNFESYGKEESVSINNTGTTG